MKKGIFIIHKSEIVRRGLQATLRNYFNVEITLLNEMVELSDFTHMTHAQIIIFAGNNENFNGRALGKLEIQNQVVVIGISERADDAKNFATSLSIDLTSTGDEIQKIIYKIFNTGNDYPPKNTDTGELTLREKEVLKMVALGHSNKEIADLLFISVHTVISHRKNITEKLGIKSISGLTVYAILNKIIDPETIDPDSLI